MTNQTVRSLPIGPRKVVAATGAVATSIVAGASYWIWGAHALLVLIALLQMATVLVVAQGWHAQQRQSKAMQSRAKRLEWNLRRVDEQVEALEATWSSMAPRLARSEDVVAVGTKVEALEQSWSTIIGALATSQDLAAHTDAVSKNVEQTALTLETRLAAWRDEQREHADRLLQRGKKGHYHEYRQIEALAALYYSLQPRRALPPTRSWTASPDFLYFLYELVRTERPERIIECGSGLSTVVMAYALEQNGSGEVVALEHLCEYKEKSERLVQEHGVDGIAHVLHAPLCQYDLPGGEFQWYMIERLEGGTCDLLVVDGPPAATQEQARYPAVPLLLSRLTNQATVVLDDYDRRDEQRAAERWQEEFPDFELTAVGHEKGTAVLRRNAKG